MSRISVGSVCRSGRPHLEDTVAKMSLSTVGAGKYTGWARRQGRLQAARTQRRRIASVRAMVQR